MGAFAKGNLHEAFGLFMRGVCGEDYRGVIEQSLGPTGYEEAVRQSHYSFRDEVAAALQWQFGPLEAGRVRCRPSSWKGLRVGNMEFLASKSRNLRSGCFPKRK
jgi:hypothetical protein